MATRKQLTVKAVEAARAEKGRQMDLWDGIVPGFGLRVAQRRKTWVGLWRLNRKLTRFSLGHYPALDLQAARRKASDWKAMVEAGKDPRRPKGGKPSVETFRDLAERYIEKHLPMLKRGHETESIIRRRLLPVWGDWPIEEFDGTEAADIVDPLVAAGKPKAARMTMEAIKGTWNWGVKLRLVPASPFRGIPLPAAARTQERDRVLTESEIRTIWLATETAGYPGGGLVRLLLLLGVRRGELANATWGEFDLEKREWAISGARTKNGKPHLVPLPDLGMEIIEGLPRFEPAGFVFTTTGGRKPINGFMQMRAHINNLAEAENGAALDHWTLHDLRRTAATHMARMNVPPHVVEKLLNHTTGQLGGVARIYNRYQYLDERRVALERWARRIESIVEDQPTEKVVHLDR